jgi:cytochrome P450
MPNTDILSRFDPFEPSWRSNPLEVFEALRDRAPIYQTATGMFIVSRYETIQRCLLNAADFSNRCVDHEALGIPRQVDAEANPDLAEMLEATFRGIPVDRSELSKVRTVIGSDGTEHQRQRRFLNRAFSIRRVRELRVRMNELATECVAKIAIAQSWDVMADLAHVIPRRIIGEMLDVEPKRHADLTRWTTEMMAATTGTERNSLAARRRLLNVLAEFTNYFVPMIDAKRANPGDDLISDLVRAEDGENGLSPLETLLTIRLLMIAGTDTTSALIGNTVLALVRRSDQAQLLIEDPSLIPNAIEESLRYWAPFYFLLRETTNDVVLEGVKIPEGSLVAMMLVSANQDPRAFEDAKIFNVRRTNNGSHVAFGHGAHRCVGAPLAREEADAAIRAVLPYLPLFVQAEGPLELAETQLLQGFRRINLIRR